ncbi:GNAT family N-acetyltransferase [Lysobacter sp. A3-1-A15]|uniref:GNAT family N-acetyltransferase n=1 Tax=Novilysobacter viscosus TaxID=3098602 RepID=UPI002EDAB00F
MNDASALRVRPAVTDDAPLLARWAADMAWETEHKRLDPDTVLRGVAAGIADPLKARYFVAVREAVLGGRETVGQAVGMLMLTTEWSDWRNGWWWWIQSVHVDPGHRRQGVFRGLYRHVREAALAEPDVLGLRLYVEQDNEAALRTYAALGMHDAGYRLLAEAFERT